MIIGIDPGKDGAIAFLDDTGALKSVHDMPTVEVLVNRKPRPRVSSARLAEMLRPYTDSRVVIEWVSAQKGEGAAGAFTFGFGCGILDGVVTTLGLPLQLVTPQAWKKVHRLPADKGAAVQMATREWPAQVHLFFGPKGGMKDGRAEAALIALWKVRVG